MQNLTAQNHYPRKHSIAFTDINSKNPRNALIRSGILLLMLSCLFCGFVIPLSDSFVTKGDDHTYYLESFLIVQYISSIASLFYLQGYIFKFEKDMKKKGIQNNVVKNESELKVSIFNSKHPCTSAKKLSLEIDAECMMMENEYRNSIENKDIENSLSRELSNITEEVVSDKTNEFKCDSEECSRHFVEMKSFPFYRDIEGINLYLRLGAVVFGFGVMIHCGFKIADQFRLRNITCHNRLWIPKYILQFLYIFIQTFFIFKYHRIVFLRQKSAVRLILSHMSVVNICQWFKTVVYEINHELHLEGYNKSFHDGYWNSSGLSCSDEMASSVSPYLFPCAIEYSLISAAIFYKMLQKVGQDYRKKHIVQFSIEEELKHSECHRSHKGLFVGLLFFMATLVGLAVFFLFKKTSSTENLAIIVYQVSEIILLISSIVGLLIAFIKIRVLSMRPLSEEEMFDDNLLLIGLAGIFSYNLFLLISAINTTLLPKAYMDHVTNVLFLTKSSFEIIQSTIQVYFILYASKKYSKFSEHLKGKPGRSHVTFLIITNLALWIVSIFETKRADQHQIFTNYYRKLPWNIITHTLLPLIIFFRFHSTVCLSSIWIKSYRKKNKINSKHNFAFLESR